MQDGLKDHQWWLLQQIRGMDKTIVRMAEIGVASGRTSELMLRGCEDLHLWMVDRWAPPPNSPPHPKRNVIWYENAMRTAMERTAFAEDRRFIIRSDSTEAASRPDVSVVEFDIVFIDAAHDYESVLRDCRAWYPRVYSRCLFCGHDIDGPKDGKQWGVRRAVTEFCSEIGVRFYTFRNIWFLWKP